MSESEPEYPKTFDELTARHAEIAKELSGAGQTAWNGTLIETDNGDLGVANWDGSLELDREAVTQPLRDMYSSPGEQRDDATLTEYRDAFVTLLHEQSHFLGPEGATQDGARIAFQEFEAQALEEGVTEAWAQDNLDDYLERTGADQIAPGIETATSETSYPEFVPAARELASGIGEQAGMTQGEVLTELNNQTAEGQWSRATDLLYESSDLPQLVPPDQEESVKQAIEQKMREEYGRLDGLDEDSPTLEAQSAAIGQDAVSAGLAEAERQEKVFAPPAAETQVDLSAQAQAPAPAPAQAQTQTQTQAQPELAGAAEAAGPAATQPAIDSTPAVGEGSGTPEAPARTGTRTPGRAAGERDADHALRLATEGQRPMGSSVRLDESSFGSRRGGGHGAEQAHGQSQRPSGPGGTGRGE
ncbi:hypothetical protein GCM10009554_24270 [Kribbella koreensis]|uniref:PPE family protein n=1 Tax=Kribbella koreensis TaxID=57909 RepID=A0ABN1Q2R3_9ACTN